MWRIILYDVLVTAVSTTTVTVCIVLTLRAMNVLS